MKEPAAEKFESPQITEAEKLASAIAGLSSSEMSVLTLFQQLIIRQR